VHGRQLIAAAPVTAWPPGPHPAASIEPGRQLAAVVVEHGAVVESGG